MKLSEFILLNDEDKRSAVMNNAVALAQWTYADIIVFLFQLDYYYIDAYWSKAGRTIEEYRVLPDANAISHYLDAIPIDDLLNRLFSLCTGLHGLKRSRVANIY